MIFCRNYREVFTDNDGKKNVLVELVCDDTPSDVDVADIVGFPLIYKEATDVVLMPGSVAVTPADGTVFMLEADGETWTAQTGATIHFSIN